MMGRLSLAALIVLLGLAGAWLLFAPVVNVPILAAGVSAEDEPELRKRWKIADGWRMAVHASGLDSPRLMQLAPDGAILVSTYRAGSVLRVEPDRDGDGRSDGTSVLIEGLDRPHGLLLERTQLYVAEQTVVAGYDYQDGRAKSRAIVLDGIPAGGHRSRTIARGPDGWLYVSIGSSCNACIETHPWRAAIIRFKAGAKPEVFALGLRNSVGFDWQPGTGALYAVNAGRDRLGDDFPPEELNRIVQGRHYGWPYVNGPDNAPDPDLGRDAPVGLTFTPPVHTFTAHSTPLSIRFLRHQPDIEPGSVALVARHGSWNRSRKSGYDVRLLRFRGSAISEEPFITGFEIDEDVVGRPVDIIEAANGDVFISDDFAGAIYRVWRDR